VKSSLARCTFSCLYAAREEKGVPSIMVRTSASLLTYKSCNKARREESSAAATLVSLGCRFVLIPVCSMLATRAWGDRWCVYRAGNIMDRDSVCSHRSCQKKVALSLLGLQVVIWDSMAICLWIILEIWA
jgi:hypothetical protein